MVSTLREAKHLKRFVLLGSPEVSSKGLEHLQRLGLTSISVGPERRPDNENFFKVLGRFTTLNELELDKCSLAYLKHLKNLKVTNLTIGSCTLSAENASKLSELSSVASMDLRHCILDDGSVRKFTEMPELAMLRFSNTEVSSTELLELVRCRKLRYLNVDPATEGVWKDKVIIERSLPRCQVIFSKAKRDSQIGNLLDEMGR